MPIMLFRVKSECLAHEEILSEHKLWLDSHGGKGKRADLREASLVWVDLEGADLQGADLRGVNLLGAHLEGADFQSLCSDKISSSCVGLISLMDCLDYF
jgi:uncharacterized protein YjbI with pentapeptide repeats